MQCQTTECTQAPILSVTLSIMFFHDAMCICHSVTLSVTPSVTLTVSLSVSFFHNTIYIRHSVSLSTSQRYRNIRNSVRRIYSLHSVTVYDCKSSRDNVRSCNVRIHWWVHVQADRNILRNDRCHRRRWQSSARPVRQICPYCTPSVSVSSVDDRRRTHRRNGARVDEWCDLVMKQQMLMVKLVNLQPNVRTSESSVILLISNSSKNTQ